MLGDRDPAFPGWIIMLLVAGYFAGMAASAVIVLNQQSLLRHLRLSPFCMDSMLALCSICREIHEILAIPCFQHQLIATENAQETVQE
jgi:hypothetical protein